MRILIITNNIEERANDISRYLNCDMNSIKFYEHGIRIQNRLCSITITDNAEMCGRERFTNIIIDKFINDSLIEQIKIHQMIGIEFTSNFYKNNEQIF